MAKLDILRKIIREEVRAVFQEELAEILKEAVISNKTQRTVTETIKPQPTIPGTLNRQIPKLVPPVLSPNNPLNSLLAETAMNMSPRDYEGLQGVDISSNNVSVVDNMEGMFAAARKSSNLEAIEINAVPDFTNIMAKMKAKGEV